VEEQRAARRAAKEEERAAEEKRLESRRAELAKQLTVWQTTYVAATRDDAGLVPGKNYGITIQPQGLRVFADKTPKAKTRDDQDVLSISSEESLQIDLADATWTSEQIRTRMRKHSYGLLGGMFRRMPVGYVEGGTQRELRFYLLVDSDRGGFAFEVHGYDPNRVSAHLTMLRSLWGQDSGEDQEDQHDHDPFQALSRLGELRDSGVLTEAEFESKKIELLKRIK
jgi:hypothetical protein